MRMPDFASRFWDLVNYLDRQLGGVVSSVDHLSAFVICVLLAALVATLLILGFTLSLT